MVAFDVTQAPAYEIHPSQHSIDFLSVTDLGEEAAVVSGQNHLHYVLQPLQAQHVRCQHYLAGGQHKMRVSLFSGLL